MGFFLRHYCGGGYGVRFEDIIVEVAMGSMWVEVAMGGPTDLVLYASGRSIKMKVEFWVVVGWCKLIIMSNPTLVDLLVILFCLVEFWF